MIRVSLIAAVAACAVLVDASAGAQPACAPRAQILGWLGSAYREAPVAAGVTAGGELVEVLARPDGRTWTIIITSPTGRTCLMAAGEGWQRRDPTKEDPKI